MKSLFLLFAAATTVFGGLPPKAPDGKTMAKFATDVLAPNNTKTRRWTSNPTVSQLFELQGLGASAVPTVINELNTALATSGTQLKLLPALSDADITVSFFPDRAQFMREAAKHHMSNTAGRDLMGWITWDDKKKISKGYAFIVADAKTTAEELHTRVATAMFDVLGFQGWGKANVESFYSQPGYKASTTLHATDVTLLQLLYHLPDQSASLAVQKAASAAWK